MWTTLIAAVVATLFVSWRRELDLTGLEAGFTFLMFYTVFSIGDLYQSNKQLRKDVDALRQRSNV